MCSQRLFIISNSFCRSVATIASLTVVICLSSASQSATAAEFYHLPDSFVTAVSSDGQSVLTGERIDSSLTQYSIWTPQTGVITTLPSAGVYYNNLSADGSTAVGARVTADGQQAVRWTASTGLVDLPTPNTGVNGAGAASADGSIIYGFMGQNSDNTTSLFRWTADGTVTELENLEDGTNPSAPIQVADDGSVVAGAMIRPLRQGYRWSSETGMTAIGGVEGFRDTLAWAISRDGTTISGFTRNAPPNYYDSVGWRWTEQSGLVSLGSFMGWNTAFETMSADGNLLLGGAWPSDLSDKTLIAWTESLGMIDIEPLLNEQAGLSFFFEAEGFKRVQIKGLSNDNRTLVGGGAFRRNGRVLEGAWAVILDRPIGSYLVPEPTTAALALLALAPLAVRRRARAKLR